MLKKILLPSICIMLLAVSCKKSSSSTNNATSGCNQNPARVGTVYIYKKASDASQYTMTGVSTQTINGLNYVDMASSLSSTMSSLAVDASGNVWMAIPAIGDLPANQMIYVKTGQPVGTTWSYTYNSLSIGGMVYKYTMTHMSITETATVGGKTYNNGIKVQVALQTTYMGAVVASSSTALTWFCGLGPAVNETSGSIYSTLTGYTY